MNNKQLKFAPVTDLELLDKSIFFLSSLCPFLPSNCLKHHCYGAMASLFELSYYLTSNHIKDYGNHEK